MIGKATNGRLTQVETLFTVSRAELLKARQKGPVSNSEVAAAFQKTSLEIQRANDRVYSAEWIDQVLQPDDITRLLRPCVTTLKKLFKIGKAPRLSEADLAVVERAAFSAIPKV